MGRVEQQFADCARQEPEQRVCPASPQVPIQRTCLAAGRHGASFCTCEQPSRKAAGSPALLAPPCRRVALRPLTERLQTASQRTCPIQPKPRQGKSSARGPVPLPWTLPQKYMCLLQHQQRGQWPRTRKRHLQPSPDCQGHRIVGSSMASRACIFYRPS